MCSQGWGTYLWQRLRRMDYWIVGREHLGDAVLTNTPAKLFRWKAPGAQVGAVLKKLDDKVETTPFSIRYFHRDRTLPPPSPTSRRSLFAQLTGRSTAPAQSSQGSSVTPPTTWTLPSPPTTP